MQHAGAVNAFSRDLVENTGENYTGFLKKYKNFRKVTCKQDFLGILDISQIAQGYKLIQDYTRILTKNHKNFLRFWWKNKNFSEFLGRDKRLIVGPRRPYCCIWPARWERKESHFIGLYDDFPFTKSHVSGKDSEKYFRDGIR